MQRRTLLGIGAAVAGSSATLWWQRNAIARWGSTSLENDGLNLTQANLDPQTCLLTPEQAEGPFFVQAPVRRDIREDRKGVNLTLNMAVVKADGCTPVEGAVAEIWHCDAAGRYSAYPENLSRNPFETMLFVGGPGHVEPTNEKRYLRGAQATSASGTVTFETIVPGWYEPRVPHIHVKVFLDNRSYLTTQLYFPTELTDQLYAQHPEYAPYGMSPYNHANDGVLGGYSDARSLLLNPRRGGIGFTADCVLAIV